MNISEPKIRPQEPQVSFLGPLFGERVSAGFPSPADDFMEARLDLNEHLIKHPAATYFVRVTGNSMLGAGIFPGDILIVDKSLEPKTNQVVVAQIAGDFLVKRFVKSRGKVLLVAESAEYEPIDVTDSQDFSIWGVVTNCIHKL